MPPTHHVSSTSRALYRVFVLPNLRSTSNGIPLQFAPAFAPTYGPPSIPISSQRLTKKGTLSLVLITEEITAAMYSAG